MENSDIKTLVTNAMSGMKFARGKDKITMTEFADAIGLERSIVYKWIDGTRKISDIDRNMLNVLSSLNDKCIALEAIRQSRIDEINEQYNNQIREYVSDSIANISIRTNVNI